MSLDAAWGVVESDLLSAMATVWTAHAPTEYRNTREALTRDWRKDYQTGLEDPISSEGLKANFVVWGGLGHEPVTQGSSPSGVNLAVTQTWSEVFQFYYMIDLSDSTGTVKTASTVVAELAARGAELNDYLWSHKFSTWIVVPTMTSVNYSPSLDANLYFIEKAHNLRAVRVQATAQLSWNP